MESREGVDLFTKHRAHVTLYLADFDLETTNENATAPASLNQTKVDSFLQTIDSLNFTSINASACPLSFKGEAAPADETPAESFFSINSDKYFIINGAYTMIPVKNNDCLQNMSNMLLVSLQQYLKLPTQIPAWVNELPDAERIEKISKIREYGSPNVLDNFDPHVTVGYDKHHNNRRMQETPCPIGQCLDLEGACRPITSCFADPCTEVPGEKCEDWEVCKPNLCGGCNFQCESLSVQGSGQDQSQLRVDAMEQWNEMFQTISGDCNGNAMGVAVGQTGMGGTVLSGSELKHWEFVDDEENEDELVGSKMKSVYARFEE